MRSGTLDRDTADKLLSSSLPGVHQPIYGKQFFIFCEVFQCHSLFAGCPRALCLSLLGGLVLERVRTPGAAPRVVDDSRSTPPFPHLVALGRQCRVLPTTTSTVSGHDTCEIHFGTQTRNRHYGHRVNGGFPGRIHWHRSGGSSGAWGSLVQMTAGTTSLLCKFRAAVMKLPGPTSPGDWGRVCSGRISGSCRIVPQHELIDYTAHLLALPPLPCPPSFVPCHALSRASTQILLLFTLLACLPARGHDAFGAPCPACVSTPSGAETTRVPIPLPGDAFSLSLSLRRL